MPGGCFINASRKISSIQEEVTFNIQKDFDYEKNTEFMKDRH